MSEELELAHRVARAVRHAGGRALIVGGWVRDRLLDRVSIGSTSAGHTPKDGGRQDIDVEVFGLPADRLRAVLSALGPVNSVGASFAVFKLGPLDISLPRTESKAGRGHRGFIVTGDPDLPLREATRRRDFTVNAIAWDPLREEHLDPHGGRDDLHRKRLRMVDPATFGDDSLRVLRAVQLAARLEFELDEPTRALCRTIALDDLPAERVWGEMEKLLLLAKRPSLGFALARDIRVVEQLFPELAALVDCPQEPEWHPEGDVWTHTLLVIDEARGRIENLRRPQRIAVMLGAVCHDFGKPATTAHAQAAQVARHRLGNPLPDPRIGGLPAQVGEGNDQNRIGGLRGRRRRKPESEPSERQDRNPPNGTLTYWASATRLHPETPAGNR